MLLRYLEQALNIRRDEWSPLAYAFAYFFFLLAGYYMLRPVREQFGVANGSDNLQYLYTGTFVTMLLIIPIFGKLSSRFARVPLIAGSNVFFAANIFAMYVLHRAGVNEIWLARVFFVWVSVYNLFVVSVFWSFMVDLFRPEQTTRLFGVIAAGGSLGAIVGGLLTVFLVTRIGSMNLLPIAGGFLLVTLLFVHRLTAWSRRERSLRPSTEGARAEEPLGGGFLDGVKLLGRSRYLAGVAGVMLMYVMTTTFLNFEQARLVEASIVDPDERTRLFGLINVAVNVLNLFIQFFLTGRLVARFGLGVVAVIMPLVTMAGLLALAVSPTLAVLFVVQILHRGGQFSLMKPAQDMLFSIVGREAKYKTKNVVDTAIYRGGDFFTSWLFTMLVRLGNGLAAMAAIGAGIAAVWAAVAWWAGRRFDLLVSGADAEEMTDQSRDMTRA